MAQILFGNIVFDINHFVLFESSPFVLDLTDSEPFYLLDGTNYREHGTNTEANTDQSRTIQIMEQEDQQRERGEKEKKRKKS